MSGHASPPELRPMNLDDIPVAMRLKDEAGWNQTEADWRRLIKARPDGCFVAVGPDSIVGTVTTITCAGQLSWVGMVLVAPASRGRGIGTTLLKHAIAYLDARGVCSIKLDATPAGRPLYEKLGFVSEYDVERWSLRRPHVDAATAFERVELDDVLSWDRQVFGVDRSALLLSFHQESRGSLWLRAEIQNWRGMRLVGEARWQINSDRGLPLAKRRRQLLWTSSCTARRGKPYSSTA